MKLALRALKVLLGLGLLGWLLAGVDFAELWAVARRGDPRLLALALFCHLLSLPLFQAWRLHVLIERYTERWSTSLHVFFIGAFFNNVLPSNVGGDAVRLLYLHKLKPESWGAPLALLVLHRISGIAVILAVAAVYALFGYERIAQTLGGVQIGTLPMRTLLWIFGALAASLALAARLAPARLRDRAIERARGLLAHAYGAIRDVGSARMWALNGLTLGFHLTRLFGFFFIVRYMGESVGVGDLIMVMAITAVVAIIPVTVGALGLMEGSITVLLMAYGVSETAAIAAALMNRMVLLLNALVGGAVYLAEKPKAD